MNPRELSTPELEALVDARRILLEEAQEELARRKKEKK